MSYVQSSETPCEVLAGIGRLRISTGPDGYARLAVVMPNSEAPIYLSADGLRKLAARCMLAAAELERVPA